MNHVSGSIVEDTRHTCVVVVQLPVSLSPVASVRKRASVMPIDTFSLNTTRFKVFDFRNGKKMITRDEMPAVEREHSQMIDDP